MAACDKMSAIAIVILFIDWREGEMVSKLVFTAKTSDVFMFSINFSLGYFFQFTV